MVRHFLTLRDYSSEEIRQLLEDAKVLKRKVKAKERFRPLEGYSLGMLFEKRSTRTRISNEAGFAFLGGHAVFLSSADIQLGVNESLLDTSRVLGRFHDLILARVYDNATVQTLAKESGKPVINALCNLYHPLQALADVVTIEENLGSIAGKTIAWIGDGNNVIHSLMIIAVKLGANVRIATPKGFETNKEITEYCQAIAGNNGTEIFLTTNPTEAVSGAHLIVTDTWISMGDEAQKEARLKAFEGYQVTRKLCEAAHPDWKFLHCLPRHKEEVDDDVFYCDRSLVWGEAENRMCTAMAVHCFLLGKTVQ
eukprot:CAMPEP_0177648984 /NCGR_PEP_ID=MMETSP0447-20121125/11124_1 /TAXON_ID=0 /ORGANISM="Stygamoeba regulata, Strain BSH-02190019" /LENGTH=309 /DNA_ID=CAMNT_0019151671 /DNA_START=88 /DNA_END=1017 /DNA_ORIENTATION=-